VFHDKEIQVPDQEVEIEQLQAEADFLRGSVESIWIEEARQTFAEILRLEQENLVDNFADV